MQSSIQREFQEEPEFDKLLDQANLTPTERRLITAHVVEGLSLQRMAAETGASMYSISNAVHLAELKLRVARWRKGS